MRNLDKTMQSSRIKRSCAHPVRWVWCLVLWALLLPAAVQAQFQYAYSFSFAQAYITAYTGSGGYVVIPETVPAPIGNATVVGIEPGVFMGQTNLLSVTVPAGVTNIGDYAFATNANLSGVYFLGDAPTTGTGIFNATTSTVYYLSNTTGWAETYAGRSTEEYTRAVLVVTPSSRAVGSGAGTTTFTVENTGGGFLTYESSESDSWLDITGSGGATLTVAYAASSALTARTGTVTVTAAAGAQGSPTNLTIVQAAKKTLTTDPSTTSHSCLAHSGLQIQIGGNLAWTAVSSATWLTISSGASGGAGDGTVTYHVAENPGAARTATITVSGGGLTRTSTVNQAEFAPTIEVNPSTQSLPQMAATGQTVSVSANISWSVVSSVDWLVVTSGSTGTDYGTVTYRVEANDGDARVGILTLSGSGVVRTITVTQAAMPDSVDYDFDGDGKADIAVFHRPTQMWFVSGSTNGTMVREWDQEGTLPVPADYDGDGKADWAAYQPESGQWQIIESFSAQTQQVAFGWYGSVPVPGDYDGDGKADLAVFDPLEGRWYFIGSQAGRYTAQWGGQDVVPVPADYDGDGATDMAVYDPYTGDWQILKSSDGQRLLRSWGWASAVPVPGDYDGDGRTDVAVFHRDDCAWYISMTGGGSRLVRYPLRGTIPVPADYDGDGKTDLAVYQPGSGYWYVLHSSTGQIVRQWWGAPTAHTVLLMPTIHAWFNLP